MNVQQAQRLAQKILAGDASPDEKAALQQYLTDHAHLPELADQLLPVTELAAMPDSVLPAGMEERILRPIMGVTPAPVLQSKRLAILRKLLRISAAAAVLAGLCLMAYRLFMPSVSPQLSMAVLLDTFSVPAGSSKDITLADGTRIRLNGGTTVRYPHSFTGFVREIYLDGEAFFEVSKDASHPFVIHSPAFTTTVLGTSFNIRSSGNQELSEVSVATGKVRVHVTGQALQDSVAFLIPGEKASYRTGDTKGLLKGKTAIATIGSWKDRHFYYDQAPLSIILNDLERAYGLRFLVKNPGVLSCTYSATFRNMSAPDMLATLALMSQVQFHKKDNLIEVSGHACN